MSGDESRKRRERLFAASNRAASEVDLGWLRHGKRPAQPGDLYVLSETSEIPVEWALLDRHPDQPELFLAVPADTGPHAGSADLVVPASEAGGPLTLRCRAQVWLHERSLDSDLYTGSLDVRVVEQAREIVRQVSERKIESGPEDNRPAYRDWIQEVIAPTQAAVGTLVPHALPRRRPPALRKWAAAASILLMTTLGLAARTLWQQGRIESLAQERTAAEEQVARQREQLAREREQSASLQRQLDAALREKERLERERQDEDRPVPLVNLPLAFLDPVGALRGDAEALRLPWDAPFLVVVLELPENGEAPTYRLTLHRQDSAVEIWRSDPFPGSNPDEVSLGLPRHLLSPGAFLLRLHGLRNGRERRLADYELRIAR